MADETPDRRLRAVDGMSQFIGMRWDAPGIVRADIRPELLNRGGLLSGVVAYALIDYSMGSALWAHLTDEEGCATLNIAINYVQTATEGGLLCESVLDRRNRRTGVLRSTVSHDDGRLMATAVGTYAIFPRERYRRTAAGGPTP